MRSHHCIRYAILHQEDLPHPGHSNVPFGPFFSVLAVGSPDDDGTGSRVWLLVLRTVFSWRENGQKRKRLFLRRVGCVQSTPSGGTEEKQSINCVFY